MPRPPAPILTDWAFGAIGNHGSGNSRVLNQLYLWQLEFKTREGRTPTPADLAERLYSGPDSFIDRRNVGRVTVSRLEEALRADGYLPKPEHAGEPSAEAALEDILRSATAIADLWWSPTTPSETEGKLALRRHFPRLSARLDQIVVERIAHHSLATDK